MPQVPDPITSPPPQGFQAYDATAPGELDAQSTPAAVYDAAGGDRGNPWPKVQEAGAIDMSTGKIAGGWPGNGTSANPWKQT